MARASATWTNTDTAHFEPADLIRTDYVLIEILQDIEHLAQTHNHDVLTANRGGALVLNESEEILFRMGAA